MPCAENCIQPTTTTLFPCSFLSQDITSKIKYYIVHRHVPAVDNYISFTERHVYMELALFIFILKSFITTSFDVWQPVRRNAWMTAGNRRDLIVVFGTEIPNGIVIQGSHEFAS